MNPEWTQVAVRKMAPLLAAEIQGWTWRAGVEFHYRGRAAWRVAVAIYRLIADGSFGPAEIEAMTAAYEAALVDLGLVDRDDPITEMVARAIVSIVGLGERDPTTIKDRALHAIGARPFNSNAAQTSNEDQRRDLNEQ